MSPFKGVGLGHGEEREQTRTLTLSPAAPVFATQPSRGTYSTQALGVRLITALSSLGLEFKAVLIPWVQQFGDRHSQEPEPAALARRQLYVAITRAQEQLHLFGSGDAPILNELRQSQHFNVLG